MPVFIPAFAQHVLHYINLTAPEDHSNVKFSKDFPLFSQGRKGPEKVLPFNTTFPPNKWCLIPSVPRGKFGRVEKVAVNATEAPLSANVMGGVGHSVSLCWTVILPGKC